MRLLGLMSRISSSSKSWGVDGREVGVFDFPWR